MPIPVYWSGALSAADLDPSFALPASAIAQGGVLPNQMGLPVVNKTGGALAAGTLVTVNGWDAATGRQTIAPASSGAMATLATWVTTASVLNNGLTTVAAHFSLGAQNTNAATVGDPVYLDTVAGGYRLTTPPPAAVIYQVVGRVAVKSASVGVVDFDLVTGFGGVPLNRINMAFPTIAVSGTTESCPIMIPYPMTILGFRLDFLSALAVNGTNFVTFSINNRTATKLLTSAVVGNSTNTGGQAIVQYAGYPLAPTAVPADLVVAANDVLTCSAVVTGTLGATLTGTWSLVYAPL